MEELRVSCSRKSGRVVMLLLLLFLVSSIELQLSTTTAQQTYVNNRQLACDRNRNDTTTLGYLCNNNSSGPTTCSSYLTFRSQPPLYNTAASIASLLRSDPSEITRLNNLSSTQFPVPLDTLLIIPISNCSCSSPPFPSTSTNNQQQQQQQYYQHNASFLRNNSADTYFSISNNTYEGLTTCQALINHNPYDYLQLPLGRNISIPLRCACPSPNQTASGIRYLLTYLIAWNDQISSIATTFGLSDPQAILDANELSPTDTIFPFTPLLIPLTTEPTRIDLSSSPSPPSPAAPVIPTNGNNNGSSSSSSSTKWVGVGVGAGVGILLLLGFLVWFFFLRRRRIRNRAAAALPGPTKYQPPKNLNAESSDQTSLAIPDSNSWSVSAEGVRFAIESLAVYNYRDLEVATGYFSEENRVKGQVYRGSFKGDYAAVKIMKGDVSGEINILKQINHSNIIRLSGFCLHQGNTYLVYEFADNGSLDDWLCRVTNKINSSTTYSVLGWKERVQIAYDIADALNYLHNFTNPPYIHKNLKSSNVLLDAHMRAKITNFGLARSLEENEDLQLTRHVVGTYGYMPPEYIENGLITPKMDVFALGVVMLELLSGKEAAPVRNKEKEENEKDEEEEELLQLSARIREVLGGQNVREKLGGFMDAALKHEYPLDLAYSMAQLASNCVALDLNSRPSASEVLMTLSKILSSSMDWDPSDELEHSRSLSLGR